jgi:carbon monoxide dehydrogenase subunit G
MELTHRFTVPVPVDQAWEHFNDIASVAECFPGATVTEADGESFQGSVKVKLGPIALVYNGSGTFTEKDATAHRMVVDAKGKDKRGNGTAGALVTMSMTDAGGATDIEVLTDLAITGKPAQFGRGVMQDVSDKLLGQFVACLEQRFATSPTPPAAEPEPTLSDESASVAAELPPVAPVAPSATPAAPSPTPASPQRSDEALNLGTTVLPVLMRSYWKHALAAVVVIVLVIWLISAL